MKIDDALRNVLRLFLDTSPVIFFVEKNPIYVDRVRAIFQRIDSGPIIGVTSPVTLAEALVVPCRLNDALVQQQFLDLIVGANNISFANVQQKEAQNAADIRARYNLSLTDSFQVAVALETKCDALLTNDARLKRITEIPILVLDDLEI